jgi:nitroreductase
LIVVASLRSTNPMYKAMVKREKTDPQAKQMLDGLRTVASRVQSTSAAVAYLMLILHQMGLGSVWMTGPLQSKAEIEKVLKIPSGMDIVTVVPVGYPAESPTKDRKPVSEVCVFIK